MPKYIEFEDEGTSASGKTLVWSVYAAGEGGSYLGDIKWWAHWRRYTLYTETLVILDSNCLREIADFCDQRTADHKVRSNQKDGE